MTLTTPAAPPPNMAELLNSIIEWACELLHAEAGEIALWSPEQRALVSSNNYGFMKSFTGDVIRPGEGMTGRVFLSGEPLIVPDYRAWEGRRQTFDAVWNAFPDSYVPLGVPMKWQGRTIGVLVVIVNAEGRILTQNDVRLASLFANVAAVAIENVRLYEALQRQADELRRSLEQAVAEQTAELSHRALQLETSAQVSRQITSILDIDLLLRRVAELICKSFGLYQVHIYLLDPQKDALVLRANSGVMLPLHREISLDMMSLNGEAARTRSAVLVNDVASDPRFLPDESLPDTRAELVVPLRVGGRVIGTLDAHSDQPGAFTSADALVIQSLGDQVAIALENARLYERSRELAMLEERNRLARELHDSVTQTIFSATLAAEAARILLKKDISRVEAQLDKMQGLAKDALTEMRTLLGQLRPAAFDAGLVAGLRRHIAERKERDGLTVAFQVEGERPLPPEHERALFRIAQEALNNVVKHAQTDLASIALTMTGEAVRLTVEDCGLGFDVVEIGARDFRLGLISMRERAEALGGTFAIFSRPGKGARIEVQIPCPDRSDKHDD